MTSNFFNPPYNKPVSAKDVFENVFTSLREQIDAFENMDYLAQRPSTDNPWCIWVGLRYTWNKSLSHVIKELSYLEKKVFKNQASAYEMHFSKTAGMSYQRELVTALLDRILKIKNTDQLKDHLTEIKIGFMQAWVIDIQLKTNSLELLAAKGEKFTLSRSRGCDALGNVILSLLQEHGKETKAKSIFKMLADLVDPVNSHPIIQGVEDEAVYWRAANGSEKKTAFGSIENRLTKYKRMV
ncbi:hypothetical protein SAMN05192560_0245 [Methylobacillus rhizosphaerae]|uniref:Uncharacterized protein n=1 Tax=Methylobacillus rhizosphaerae TaxID=551994 RepID=A0A238XVM2_9PROT|nr:hypothetical protein [Methylobacillus rhizosphaerae]SNR63045.1 hypothetical protein SAMN05192560_0245 [Methylobacillus rhizosphaerae]